MVRKILTGENSSIQPILSLSLLVACIAASIAIISSLCGLSRKKSHSPTSTIEAAAAAAAAATTTTTTTTTITSSIETPNTKAIELEDTRGGSHSENEALPPPLGELRGSASYHVRSKSAAPPVVPRDKLSTSLSISMGMQGNGMGSRLSTSLSMSMGMQGNGMGSRQQSQKKKEKKSKHEDSIWKKTIILGERCKIPEEDDDAIIYDEKGNRISTYHRKTASSLPVSRQASCVDEDAIPWT